MGEVIGVDFALSPYLRREPKNLTHGWNGSQPCSARTSASLCKWALTAVQVGAIGFGSLLSAVGTPGGLPTLPFMRRVWVAHTGGKRRPQGSHHVPPPIKRS